MQTSTMTIRRALRVIEVFDGLEAGQNWDDAQPKDLRNALDVGSSFDPRLAIWPELWARYKSKDLHRSVRELYDNLDKSKLSKAARKEIEDGLNRIGY